MAKFAVIYTVVTIAAVIVSIVDIARIEDHRVKHLPKLGWIIVVVVLQLIGAVLWFALGRERSSESAARQAREAGHPVGTGSLRLSRPVAPDDDPDFLLQLRKEREQEERIRKLEEKLAELDDDSKPQD